MKILSSKNSLFFYQQAVIVCSDLLNSHISEQKINCCKISQKLCKVGHFWANEEKQNNDKNIIHLLRQHLPLPNV